MRPSENKNSNQHEDDYHDNDAALLALLLLSAIIFTHDGCASCSADSQECI
jgi:hypothetical protein